MVLDVHVHYFPDGISQKTAQALGENADIKPLGDGSMRSLLEYMDSDKIDLSVNLPVATRADQVSGINRKVVEQSRAGGKVLSFGAMHPQFASAGNVREELHFLSEQGVKGIKLHPEYQSFYPDDPNMAPIYEACRDYKLIIAMHAGKDIAFETVHATPKRIAEIPKILSLNLILAHMGGYRLWDEVEQYLVGVKSVYFDTAFTLEMENWQMKEIILGHSPYQIVFGSDFPWQRAADIVKKIEGLGLGKEFEERLLYKNGMKLLGL